MNRIYLMAFLICAAALGACDGESGAKAEKKVPLSEQLEGIKSGNISEIGDIPGNTRTEKLLYLQGSPDAVKSATLIFMDGQIETLEASGEDEVVESLRKNRKFLVQAIDDNIQSYLESAAEVIETVFTPEEIEQLVEIYNSDVMRKMTDNQINIQQSLLPIAEEWGEDVAGYYQDLIQKDAAAKNKP